MLEYEVYDTSGQIVCSGIGRVVGKFLGIRQQRVWTFANRKTRELLFDNKYDVIMKGTTRMTKSIEKLSEDEKYIKTIEDHLDRFGNTIVTRIRLKRHTIDEIMERLKRDGYEMKEPRKAMNLEGKWRDDYWIIEGERK